MISLHPSYLALHPEPQVRQRHDRTRLVSSTDPRAEARDPRWTPQRDIGRPAFVARYVSRRGRPRIGCMPQQNQGVRGQIVSGTVFFLKSALLSWTVGDFSPAMS